MIFLSKLFYTHFSIQIHGRKLNSNLAVVLIAVAIVAGSFVTSQTGFATASPFDFAVAGVDMPALITANTESTFTATLENLGKTSATAVIYSYEVLNPSGNRLYYGEDRVDLLANSRVTIPMKTDELGNGVFTFRINIDTVNNFAESDETNNGYELQFTVPYGV